MNGLRTFVTESVVLRGMGSWLRRNSAVKSFHTCLTLFKDGFSCFPLFPLIVPRLAFPAAIIILKANRDMKPKNHDHFETV